MRRRLRLIVECEFDSFQSEEDKAEEIVAHVGSMADVIHYELDDLEEAE